MIKNCIEGKCKHYDCRGICMASDEEKKEVNCITPTYPTDD